MADKIKKLKYPTKENCLYLESLNLSYKEMQKLFECKVSIDTIKNNFHKYGIIHKNSKNRLMSDKHKLEDILFNNSIKGASIKYGVSIRQIVTIRKEYKMRLDTKIIKALDKMVWFSDYGVYLLEFRETIRNSKEERIEKPKGFINENLWSLLVLIFGDYKVLPNEGWINLSDNKNEIMGFLSAITNTTKEELGFYD